MSGSSPSAGAVTACGREDVPLALPMLDDPRPFYARARRDEPVSWSESLGLRVGDPLELAWDAPQARR